MANDRMQRNFEQIKRPAASLKESVDFLRNSVNDLYYLDEDNYQMIQNLEKALDKTNDRLNKVTRRYNTLSRATGCGLILLAIGLKILKQYIAENNERSKDLETKIDVLSSLNEKEESDG